MNNTDKELIVDIAYRLVEKWRHGQTLAGSRSAEVIIEEISTMKPLQAAAVAAKISTLFHSFENDLFYWALCGGMRE